MAGFLFTNHLRVLEEKPDSNRIGIHSICNMMSKMGGRCESDVMGDTFTIKIVFPCVTIVTESV